MFSRKYLKIFVFRENHANHVDSKPSRHWPVRWTLMKSILFLGNEDSYNKINVFSNQPFIILTNPNPN